MYRSYVNKIHDTSWWRLIILPLLVAIAVLMIIPVAVTALLTAVLGGDLQVAISPASTVGMWVGLVGGSALMIWASKLSWARLGYQKRGWPGKIALGILIGAAALAAVALVIAATGAVTISWAFTPEALGPILLAACFFAAQGTWEELVYRSYLMPFFSKKWGDVAGIVITSLLFAAGHAANPGMTFMPVLNLVIFGFVFALIYYRSGNLFLAGAIHATWNFCQGFLFGSEVSGNAVKASVLQTTPVTGHELLSGGSFGFEGSIVTSIFGLIFIAVLIWGVPRLTSKAGAQEVAA